MKKFLTKIAAFTLLTTALFLIPFFYFPNLMYQNSILAELPVKHKMLAQSTSPKIIFIGGSNVSMGLNSEKIADTYHLPVVNTSIALWLGLKFMVNDVKPYIKKGDIVVISGEYNCYDESLNEAGFEGYEALLTVVFNIFPPGKSYIDNKQWIHLAKFIPHYVISAIRYSLLNNDSERLTVESAKKEFNKYGDLYTHWKQPKIPFKPEEKCMGNEKLNPDVIPLLKKFNNYVLSKGATLVLIPPPMQDSSYQNQYYVINKIESQLKNSGLPFIAKTSRYELNDKYFNDLGYHLTKAGVDIRTDLVIEDLSKVITAAKTRK